MQPDVERALQVNLLDRFSWRMICDCWQWPPGCSSMRGSTVLEEEGDEKKRSNRFMVGSGRNRQIDDDRSFVGRAS
jgi:hypothetical protein